MLTDYQPKNQCTDDNSNCPSWAKSGECTANPGYMKVNCKKSCNTCSISQCQESNPTDCANRAASGQCTTNTGYMKVNCKKACNQCCKYSNNMWFHSFTNFYSFFLYFPINQYINIG
jgi:hypothetical protein